MSKASSATQQQQPPHRLQQQPPHQLQQQPPHRLQQQSPHRLQRTANNVINATRVAKNSYCDYAGWASKQGSIIKTWKRRYFVLKGRELIYFAERSPSGKGIDEKGRIKVVGAEFTPEVRNGLLIKGELKNQTMKLTFETNDDSLEWYGQIKAALAAGSSSSNTGTSGTTGNSTGTAAVTMQGWLSKEGQNFKTWKKRYMTLTGRVIKYHARAGEAPLGEAVVNDYNVNPSKPFALDVFSDNNRIFRIAADSFADIEAWDLAISNAIHKAPCFGDPYADQKAPFLGETFNDTTLCDGWLYKRGQRATAWKRRFFTLSGFTLAYHESPGENAKGAGSVVDLALGDDGSNVLEIQLDTGRVLTVSADTREQLDVWVNAICEVLDKDPLALEAAASSRASMGGSSTSTTGTGANTGTATGTDMLRRGLSLGASRQSNASLLHASTSGSSDDDERISNTGTARKTGWLKKQGKHMKSWKRRFFIVDDRTLSYFEQLHDAPLGTGVISSVGVNPLFPNCLDIALTSGRVLRVAAETPDEIRLWYQHIHDVTTEPQKVDTDGDCGPTGDASGLSHTASRGTLSHSNSSSSTDSGTGNLNRQTSFDRAVAATASPPTEPGRGWLMKKGSNFKTWKRRYFVVDGTKLTYATNVGEPPLGCGLVSYVTLGNARPFCIDVRFKNGRVLNVAASSDSEMITWCRVLQHAIKTHAATTTTRASTGSTGSSNDDTDAHAAEFDFDDHDDDNDDNDATGSTAEPRGRPSGLPTGRSSQSQLTRPSLNQRPSGRSSSSLLNRGSSLDSDESLDDGSLSYLDMGRASLDDSLPGCSGWLRKEGSTIKNWKRRYFTLNGTLLSYFKSDNGPLIKTLKVCHVLVMRTKKLCLEITAESGRKLLVAADTSAEYDRWLAALHQAVVASKSKKEKERESTSGSSSSTSNARKIVRL